MHGPDGEMVLAFDTGHGVGEGALSSAADASTRETDRIVVGLSADTSEADPVLVTAGADGTVRVHALMVRLMGKRVAGVRDDAEKKRERERSRSGVDDGSSRRRKKEHNRKGALAPTAGKISSAEDGEDSGRDRPGVSLPATAMGVEISAGFRICLGSGCGDGGSRYEPATIGETVQEGHASYIGDESKEAADGPPQGKVPAVTSLEAFYHRA